MATSASKKKQKKAKGKTIALTDFLADEKGGPPPSYVSAKGALDWAAEMENQENTDDVQDIDYGGKSHFDRSVLPTAPKAARGPDVDLDRIPSSPPFTAFIGNLPYEASEERIEEFFKKLRVVNVRLPTDQGRLRGFGYVEFEDRESLIEALTMNDSIFSGRKIRVDLAGQNQQGGDRDRSDYRRSDEPDRTDTDWRRRDPAPDNDRGGDRFGDRDRGFGSRDGGRYGDRDRGFDRDGGGRFGGGRDGGRFGDRDGGSFGRDRYGDRDGGRYGDRDGGRFGDRDGGRYGDRDGGRFGDRGGRFGDRDGDRFGGRSRGFSDRDGGRRGFGSGFREGDEDPRGSYGGGSRYSSDRGPDGPSSGEASQETTKERPRLQLQPRSKPVEASEPGKEERKSSIFGGAKPVDTSARDREIEERLAREREMTSSRFDEEKENRNYDNRREISTGSRTRRDSDRSDGGSKRERRLSSSSGKGARPGPPPVTTQRSRRDSELSNHSDVFNDDKEQDPKQPMSPKKEESSPKLVDAPPPKENAWSKRPSAGSSPGSQSSEPRSPPANSTASNAWCRGKPEHRSEGMGNQDGPRRSGQDNRGNGYSDRGRGRGRGQRESGSDKKPVREKHIPKSIDEMPKYEEKAKKDWSDRNKYSFLMDEEGEGNDSS